VYIFIKTVYDFFWQKRFIHEMKHAIHLMNIPNNSFLIENKLKK